MAVKRLLAWMLILGTLAGCASTESPARIALLAPFEGRYREVGYSALYPARLAFEGETHVELLAIDDGGSIETAIDRAHALALDPLVKAVIVLGHHASDPAVQAAFGDIPVIVVGYWYHEPIQANVFMYTSAEISALVGDWQEITADPMPIGGDVYALSSMTELHSGLQGIQVVSSGTFPDEAFMEWIQASDQFATDPGLLGTSVYDVARLLIELVNAPDLLEAVHNTGIFADGYWKDAPVNYYEYSDGNLS